MRWFRKLFVKNNVVVDPTFGQMTFEGGSWTALPNPAFDYMVCVEAGDVGPSELQRDYFKRIQEKLPPLLHDSRLYIGKQLAAERIEFDSSSLGIYAVYLGEDSETSRNEFTLELSDQDAHLIQCVKIENWSPILFWQED